ncbi:Aste57867_2682 [Aphanomyces stellatus]|uniref:Aste57867_2682 protein n=1 Tax=Aphanomyces stellatus TaxID=120398 RepID=A0A485KAL8_9STRA|nr:hypothetical protein As57867_002675 [Aphanomyces stellatus]VFT79876.1 Aste57867_2682 [Aphanomyces stellatus]
MMSLAGKKNAAVFDSFVLDFMQLNHNPVEEELQLQCKTERLLDRWHGLVLKKGNSHEDDVDAVEDRIQRNIHRHKKTLAWLSTMERHMQHDAIAYADADLTVTAQPKRVDPTLVGESERILNQIDALLNERREWEASFAVDMALTAAPSLSIA